MWTTRVLASLDRIPEVVILGLNAAMGSFVFLAHGGALLLVLSGRVPTSPGYAEMVRNMVPITLPVSGLVVVGSAIGLVWKHARRVVFPLQATVLFISALAALGWASTIVVRGIPEGTFSWGLGLLTGWMAYSTLLFTRCALHKWKGRPLLVYLPVMAGAVTLAVEIGVFLRLLRRMSQL